MNNLKFNTSNFKLKLYDSGIARIKYECKLHGVIKPKFEEFVHGFKVTLYKEKFNEPVKLILKLVKENPYITKQQMIEKTNLSRATITRYIKKLKEQNLLKRIGSDKTGYWEVLDDK